MDNKLEFLGIGEAKYTDLSDWYVKFITDFQLKDKYSWSQFTGVFTTTEDSDDPLGGGWRGEFFGKAMRGACLVYRYSNDQELYEILTDVVKDLLKTQDQYGRISAYAYNSELYSWDLWCRKYVTTGLLHYYEICKDEDFKKEILEATKRHVDYILSKIGPEEGKTEITDSSRWYGAMNSSTLLEPVLDLYTKTNEQRYLDFATYIVSKGGCKDGSLIDLAIENKKAPFEYPQTKAYEMMSFFEGVLKYYQVTGIEKYYVAAKNFIKKLMATDVSIIGCSGCHEELLNNSSITQTIQQECVMQETCVAVTYVRLLTKFMLLEGDISYMDDIETSIYNCIYGSVNTNKIKGHAGRGAVGDLYNMLLDPLPFDSYSPLTYGVRAKGVGGHRSYKNGFFYGCCACIGAAGIGLAPLTSVLKDQDTLYITNYFSGSINTLFNNKRVSLEINSKYLTEGKVVVKIKSSFDGKIVLRIPNYVKNPTIKLNGESFDHNTSSFNIGDVIEIDFNFETRRVELNDSVAYLYGPTVLALDLNNNLTLHHFDEIKLDKNPEIIKLTPRGSEYLRYSIGGYLYTNYSASGKNWIEEPLPITVWVKKK